MGLWEKILDYRNKKMLLNYIWKESEGDSVSNFDKAAYYAVRMDSARRRGDEEGELRNKEQFEYYCVMDEVGDDYGFVFRSEAHAFDDMSFFEEFLEGNNYEVVEQFSNLPRDGRKELGQRYYRNFCRKKIDGFFILHPSDLPNTCNKIEDVSLCSPALVYVKKAK